MAGLDTLMQRFVTLLNSTPQLQEEAEDELADLVDLLEARTQQSSAQEAPAHPPASPRAGTPQPDANAPPSHSVEALRAEVIKRTSSKTHLAGDVAVDGGFTQEVLHETVPASSKDSAKCDLANRRRSIKFIKEATSRAISQENVFESEGSLSEFKAGFMRFKNEVVAKHKDFFKDLAAHQQPKVMVIGCCDSRVDPALLMGAGPGDIFVFRNIANMVPPYERQGNFHGTSAALEYAVLHLKVQHIVVMGHKSCGGIKALMSRDKHKKEPTNDFIDTWVEIGAPAAERTKMACAHMPFAQQCAFCEREAINVSLANLLTFPWIKEAVGRKALHLHGWYYDLEQAVMDTWQLRYQLTDYERI